jgi:hypothetical protein
MIETMIGIWDGDAVILEHLQEFGKIYLANTVFGQLLKSYAK